MLGVSHMGEASGCIGILTRPKSAGKVFFLARSPEAPKTIMTVFSLSSMVLFKEVSKCHAVVVPPTIPLGSDSPRALGSGSAYPAF